MNSKELLLEVRRLKEVKEKNDKAILKEDLQGKYRKSYEKLCNELRQAQCELRTAYVHALKLLAAVMLESVYVNSKTEDEWLRNIQKELLKETGGDPLLKELFLSFWMFGDTAVKNI